jgi:dihydrofolate reductase
MFKQVVFSRTTWLSMGSPILKGRYLLIVSSDQQVAEEFSSKVPKEAGLSIALAELDTYLDDGNTHRLYRKRHANSSEAVENYESADIVIAGGAKLYEHALSPCVYCDGSFGTMADNIYVTHIPGDYNCDTFFPHHLITNEFKKVTSVKGTTSMMEVYSIWNY